MATSAGAATQTVKIIIITDATQAKRALAGIGDEAEKTGRKVQQSTTTIGTKIKGMTATIGRALLSMLGVMVAFNLLVALPEKIISGVAGALVWGLNALGEFQERVIAAKSILAGTQEWFKDPIKNYEYAGQVADSVMTQLLRRSGELRGEISDVMITFQTLLNVGVGNYTKNMQEVVDLTILLSNATSVVTVGQDQGRQAAEETRNLLMQQNRASALLVRYMFGTREEMEKFMASARDDKDLLDKIEKKLVSMKLAAKELGESWGGIKTSLKAAAVEFARSALGPLFEKLRQTALGFLQHLKDNKDAVDNIAVAVQALISFMIEFAGHVTGLNFKNWDEALQGILDTVPRIAYWTGYLVALFKEFFLYTKLILPFFSWWFTLFAIFAETINTLLIKMFENISRMAGGFKNVFTGNFEKGFTMLAEGAGSAVGAVATGIGSGIGDLVAAVKWYSDELKRLQDLQDPKAAGEAAEALYNAYYGKYLEAMKKMRKKELDLSAVPTVGKDQPFDWETYLDGLNSKLRLTESSMRILREELDNMQTVVEGGLTGKTFIESLITVNDQFERLQTRIVVLQAEYDAIGDLIAIVTKEQGASSAAANRMNEAQERLAAILARLKGELVSVQRAMLDLYETSFTEIMKRVSSTAGSQFATMFTKAVRDAWTKNSKVTVNMLDSEGNIISSRIEEISRSLSEKIKDISLDLKDVWSGLMAGLKEQVIPMLFAFGNMMADVVEGVVNGSMTIGQAFKDLAASVLSMMARLAIQWGTVCLMVGAAQLLMGDPDGAKLMGIGAALIAVGTGMMMLSAAIKGKQGSAGASGSAGGGGSAGVENRTVYLEPYPVGVFEQLTASIKDLNKTMSDFGTKSPGIIVKEGAAGASRALVSAVTVGVRQNTVARADLGKAILQES